MRFCQSGFRPDVMNQQNSLHSIHLDRIECLTLQSLVSHVGCGLPRVTPSAVKDSSKLSIFRGPWIFWTKRPWDISNVDLHEWFDFSLTHSNTHIQLSMSQRVVEELAGVCWLKKTISRLLTCQQTWYSSQALQIAVVIAVYIFILSTFSVWILAICKPQKSCSSWKQKPHLSHTYI